MSVLSEPTRKLQMTARHVMQTLTIVILLVLAIPSADAQYIRGPQGGCYIVSKTGRKQYVDRSMCNGKSGPAPTAPSARNAYIQGPRGGCYYITPSGRKQYVDHSLCR